MSDIYTGYSEHDYNFRGGIIVDIAEEDIRYAINMLDSVGNARKAVGMALSRAAASGKTVAKKIISQEYTISQSTFLSETKNTNFFTHLSSGEIRVSFGFRGYVIPLLRFNTSVNSDGHVVTQVMRSSVPKTLDRAFIKQMKDESEHVYERVGKARFPVRKLYGPSTPQMMGANEAVWDAMEGKMVDTFEKRVDHEILRILNGWGR